MKTVALILVALSLTLYDCKGSSEIDALAKKIETGMTDGGWVITKDLVSITLTRKNVQLLNPINLPGGIDEDKIWEEYALKSDYRITIVLDPKLSQVECDRLRKLREELIAARTKGLKPGTRDYLSSVSEAKGVLRLPNHYWGRFSVYFYSSDEWFFDVRPVSVTKTRDKILQILDKTCSKYKEAAL